MYVAIALITAMLVGVMPAHAADCSIFELKAEAIDDFLDEHYSVGVSSISLPDEDTGVMEVMFWPNYPPDHWPSVGR